MDRNTFENVPDVYLSGASFTDQGLATIALLPGIEMLFLHKTEITDDGLVHLKKLPKLQFLYLRGTQVTDVGVEELQQALPRVTVVR